MHELTEGPVIVGAGLSGLALAAALRGRGPAVEMLAGRLGGQAPERGLLLWGGALAALDRIGMGDRVRVAGAPIHRLQLWSDSGRLLLEVSRGSDGDGFEGVSLRGSTLVTMLRAASADVPITVGRRLLGYAEDDHGVELTLDHGWPVRAPLVIGADGLGSAVRMQCLDDGAPVYSGDSVWEGIAPEAPKLAPGTVHLYWGRYGLRGGAVALEHPRASAWWVELATGAGGEQESGPRKPELRMLLEEMRGPLPELVEATGEEAIRRTDVHARRAGSVAGKGRVTLIGDAAHPLPVTLRLGGSLAIEDGVELADALVGEPDQVEALRRFERLRSAPVRWTCETLWRLRAFEARVRPAAAQAIDVGTTHLSAAWVRRLLQRLLAGPAFAGAAPDGRGRLQDNLRHLRPSRSMRSSASLGP